MVSTGGGQQQRRHEIGCKRRHIRTKFDQNSHRTHLTIETGPMQCSELIFIDSIDDGLLSGLFFSDFALASAFVET